MVWLQSQGFEAVTLDQRNAAWHGDGNLPPKPIVISFDDGVPGLSTKLSQLEAKPAS